MHTRVRGPHEAPTTRICTHTIHRTDTPTTNPRTHVQYISHVTYKHLITHTYWVYINCTPSERTYHKTLGPMCTYTSYMTYTHLWLPSRHVPHPETVYYVSDKLEHTTHTTQTETPPPYVHKPTTHTHTNSPTLYPRYSFGVTGPSSINPGKILLRESGRVYVSLRSSSSISLSPGLHFYLISD